MNIKGQKLKSTMLVGAIMFLIGNLPIQAKDSQYHSCVDRVSQSKDLIEVRVRDMSCLNPKVAQEFSQYKRVKLRCIKSTRNYHFN